MPGSMAGRFGTPRTALPPDRVEGVSGSLVAVPAAFSDLMEISSQVEAAIVLDGDEIVASSVSAKGRSEELAAAIRQIVETAEKTRAGLKQLEIALPEG